MTSITPVDQDIRDRIRTQLHRTLFVEAGAGTGKTTELVARILALVTTGRLESVAHLAAITFTENAAAELRTRVREALESAAADTGRSRDERLRCGRALNDFDDAAISTLHGFASRILADAPLEAGLPPGFAIQDEIRAALDADHWWRDLVDSMLAEADLAEVWRHALALGLAPGHLREIADAFAANWDLLEQHTLPDITLPAVDVDAIAEPLREAVTRYADAGPEGDRLTSYLRERLRPLLDDLSAEPDAVGRLAVLAELKIDTSLGTAKAWAGLGLSKKDVTGLLAAAKAKHDAAVAGVKTAVLTVLMSRLRGSVLTDADRRRREGRLRYHDLLVLARRVLRDDPGVRAAMHRRWRVIMVDEFQDTDPLQVEIVHLIASGATASSWEGLAVAEGAVFFVGDPKQSIYRFRRAEVGLYQQVGQRYAAGHSPLVQNFRSRPAVLRAVNTVFQRLMNADPQQIGYRDLAAARPSPPDGSGPAVLLLGGPDTRSLGEIRESEAHHVAVTLRRARGQRWLVGERGTDDRPVRYADMAILVPTRTSLGQLEDALQHQDIPYRIESRSLIWSTDAVRGLITILQAVHDPGDQVALLAALRHPAFACSDDDLAEWSAAGGRWDYHAPVPGSLTADHPVAAAMRALRDFHELRWWLPVNLLIDRVIRERRMVELTTALRRPRDHWRRLRYVVDQARAFADSGGAGLGEFLAWAEEQIERGADAIETVVPEPDDDAVRILTIHGSKGLEFPLVALTGLNVEDSATFRVIWTGTGPQAQCKGFFTAGFEAARTDERAREMAENVRLLYVAMTRPRDHLVVSLYHKQAAVPRCHAGRVHALVPALRADGAAHEVTVPELAVAPSAAAAPAMPGDLLRRRAAFLTEREELLTRVAARVPVTASTLAAAGPATAHDEPPDELAPAAGEPAETADEPVSHRRTAHGGATLGTAVHRVLELADLGSWTDEAVTALARLACAEGAAPQLVPEVTQRALSALQSETVRAAARNRHWKEVPVVAEIDGRYVEGYIDLLYETTAGLAVVDYKTDAITSGEQLQGKVTQYAAQIGAYARAIQLATGADIAGTHLLFVGAHSSQAVAVTADQPAARTGPGIPSSHPRVGPGQAADPGHRDGAAATGPVS